MNEALARNLALLVQRYRGWDYREPLRSLEALERADASTLNEFRMKKLRSLLEHCERSVPFYREAFRAAGFRPSEVSSVADLSVLPIIDKSNLREDYSKFLSEGYGGRYDFWSSSGSTGEPFAFRIDRESAKWNTFAALARGRRWWGIEPGTREAMIWSGVRDISDTLGGRFRAVGRRFSWRLKNIILVDTYDLDHEKVERGFKALQRFRPEVTRSISSGLYRFASLVDELGLDGKSLGIRFAIYTGEAFPETQRREVERILGCKAICEYGCTELGIIAFECPDGGLHLMHENLVLEFLKDGRPALAGEAAELVVTNLNNYAAPLIRYAVGDVVVPTHGRCSCGRSMPLIDSVAGRSHAVIRTPAGAVVHGLFFTHLFDDVPEVHRFRVVQHKLDSLRLELTSTERISDETRSSLRKTVSEVMGEGVVVEVSQVDDLPLTSSGKFQWIVSELDDANRPPTL